MMSLPALLVVSILSVIRADATNSEESSEDFPAFSEELQTCDENNDYQQINQLLKKCGDGEIRLKPEELKQCAVIVMQPLLLQLGNSEDNPSAIGITMEAILTDVTTFAKLLSSGDILNILTGFLSGVPSGVLGFLKPFLGETLDGLSSRNLVGGLLDGLDQGLIKGSKKGVEGLLEGEIEGRISVVQ